MWAHVRIWATGFPLNGCVAVESTKLPPLEGTIDAHRGVSCEAKRLLRIFTGTYVSIAFRHCVYDAVMIHLLGVARSIHPSSATVLDRVTDVDNSNSSTVISSSMINRGYLLIYRATKQKTRDSSAAYLRLLPTGQIEGSR